MTVPTLGIVIPTAGRATLRRTLESMDPQMLPGDTCLVVGDVLDGPLPVTAAIVHDFPWCRYLEHAGTRHTYGHEQINVGLPLVGGEWVGCQDDDDVFTPDAFATIRATIASLDQLRPLLFRFRSYLGGRVYWDEEQRAAWRRSRQLLEGHIGGHCLWTRNLPGLVGVRGLRYAGDYDWIVDTVRRWAPVDPLWCEEVIAVARPKE